MMCGRRLPLAWASLVLYAGMLPLARGQAMLAGCEGQVCLLHRH